MQRQSEVGHSHSLRVQLWPLMGSSIAGGAHRSDQSSGKSCGKGLVCEVHLNSQNLVEASEML